MSDRCCVTSNGGTAGFYSEPTRKPPVVTPDANFCIQGSLDSRSSFRIIRGNVSIGGVWTLSLASLIFAAADRSEAGPSGASFPDDGNIQFKDLTNDFGVIELTTADGRTIILDDPGETLLLRRVGSSISESHVTNSVATMLSYAKDQQDALKVFMLGQTGPAGVGNGGSSTLFQETPSLTPINFVPPPDNIVPLNLLSTPNGAAGQNDTFVPFKIPLATPPPVLTVPPTVTSNEVAVTESGSVPIAGVSVANVAGAELTVSNGTLHVDENNLPSGVTVTGNNTDQLFVSGNSAAVNAVIEGLTYTRTGPGDEGTDTLTVSVTGTDGSQVTATSTITINPIAEQPTASIAEPVVLEENASSVAVTGVIVGPLAEDSDDTVSATLTVAHGTLHINAHNLPPGLTVVGNNSGSLEISGDAAAVNTLLAGLTYTPASEYEGTDTLSLSVTSTDGTNTFPTPATALTTITIEGVADTPIVCAPHELSTTVNHAAVGLTGLSVQPGDTSANDALDTFNVTLSVEHGSLAVTEHAGLTGSFVGSTVTFSGSLSAVQAALADNNITYTPKHGFEGTDTLHFTASTTEEAGVGGETSAPDSTSTSINVNEIPDLHGYLVGLDDGNAVEHESITVASPLNDGGHPVFLPNDLVAYSWEVSTDGGVTWEEVGTQRSFTPSAAELGDELRVVITYDERAPQNPENEGLDTLTLSAGTVENETSSDPTPDSHLANSTMIANGTTPPAGGASNFSAGSDKALADNNSFVFKPMASAQQAAVQFEAIIDFNRGTDFSDAFSGLGAATVQVANAIAEAISDNAHRESDLHRNTVSSTEIYLAGTNINFTGSDILHHT